jgi:hypothetical protein
VPRHRPTAGGQRTPESATGWRQRVVALWCRLAHLRMRPKPRKPVNKLERAGLKTYAQVIQPKDGRRIRVRVGPFESKPKPTRWLKKSRSWTCRLPFWSCRHADPCPFWTGFLWRCWWFPGVGPGVVWCTRCCRWPTGSRPLCWRSGLRPTWRSGCPGGRDRGGALCRRFVLVFVAALFAGGLVAFWSAKLVAAVGLRPVDRVLGAAFGVVRGVVVLLVVTVVVGMTPMARAPWWQESGWPRYCDRCLHGLKPVLPQDFGKYLP